MTFILTSFNFYIGFPDSSVGKNLPAMQETWVLSLDWEDPLEKGKAAHSGILTWRIPWTFTFTFTFWFFFDSLL